jgi:hypothetical protein
MKVLDPETATLEEVALAGRNLARAKHAGVIVGGTVAVGLVMAIPASLFLQNWAVPVVIVAFAAAYRLTCEILMKVLGSH